MKLTFIKEIKSDLGDVTEEITVNTSEEFQELIKEVIKESDWHREHTRPYPTITLRSKEMKTEPIYFNQFL